MKKFFALLVLAVAVQAAALDQKPAAKPASPPAKTPQAITVSVDHKLKIRTIQVDFFSLQQQDDQLQKQHEAIVKQLDQKGQELNKEVKDAVREAGVDPDKYTLDRNLNVVELPKQTQQAPEKK
jgi:hypothetical protein